MSFQDYDGLGPSTEGGMTPPSHVEGYSQIQSKLSLQIFKIRSNAQGMAEILRKLSSAVHIQNRVTLKVALRDLNQATKELVKSASEYLKEIISEAPERQDKLSANKLYRDYEAAVNKFQRIQRASVAYLSAMEESPRESTDTYSDEQPGPVQQQLYHVHDNFIAERNREIREIQSGVMEVQGLILEVASLVNQQEPAIGHFASNIQSVRADLERGNEELEEAVVNQRKAHTRSACFMIIVGVVLTVIIIAVLG